MVEKEERGEGVAKAYSTFNAWAEATEPDSLELTIVFRQRGGYILALSPERSRLERRCLGFDRTHRVILMMMTWCKPIDTINPFLRKLREYVAAPVASFILGGAVHAGPALTADSSNPALLPASGADAMLKFEITIVDEADVKPDTVPWIAMQMASPTSRHRSKKKAELPSPSEIAKHRSKMLRTHFPVTLERLRRSPDVPALVQGLAADGIAAWQIAQTLCNLIVARSMSLGRHYTGLSSDKEQGAILRALTSLYAVADSGGSG